MPFLMDPKKTQYANAMATKDMWTPTFAKKYVQVAGTNLHVVPEAFITEELCLTAVKTAGTALQFVPAKMITEEMCALALDRATTALKYIPAKFQKSHLVLKTLLKNKNARAYIKKGAPGFNSK